MRVHLLGPVHVNHDGHRLHLPPQQLVLLAALVLAPSQPVDTEYLMSRMWPDGRSRPMALRQAVTALRRSMPDQLPPRRLSGQVVTAFDRADIDYYRFQDGVKHARSRGGQERATILREALKEWQAEALIGVKNQYFAKERAELAKEHVKAVKLLLQVLENSDPAGFRYELRRAREMRPNNWPLFEIELRWRWGTGDADVEGFYTNHVDRYGLPPARIQRWYTEHRRRRAPRTATRLAPRQVPMRRPSLFGRDEQIVMLNEALLEPGMDVRRVAVTGMAGVGKTELVNHWAGAAVQAFPDGVFYADLRGYGQTLRPERASQTLAVLLADLGVESPLPTLDSMINTFRTTMSTRRALVVFDNARDAGHVRPLLPGDGPSAVIVTSRDSLESLQVTLGFREFRLEPLAVADASAMLRADIGSVRIRDAEAEIEEVAALCGGLPLTLSIVAARLRGRRWETLTEVTALLRDERSRLDTLGLRANELDIRAALNASTKVLTRPAAGLLARLAVHPGPTIGWKAVVALCADRHQALSSIERLVAANLVEAPTVDRYALHDLVRLHASESAQRLSARERADAIERVYGYLLRNAHACDRVLAPDRLLPMPDPGLGELGPQASLEQAMNWLDGEYATLTTAVRRAGELGIDRYCWMLALVLVTFQWRTGRYADAERYLRQAAIAADRSADPDVRTAIRRVLGGSLRGLGECELAREELRQAVAIGEEAGDKLGVAFAYQQLALLQREAGETQAAIMQYELALNIFRKLGSIDGEAHALAGLADARLDAGDLVGAQEYGEAARILFDESSDHNGRANTVAGLGRIHAAAGNPARAIIYFRDAAERYRELHYRSREARLLIELADSQLELYEVDEACDVLRRARDLFEGLGDIGGIDAAEARLRTLGA
ncbi:AfsR/SARP family transcriptional regulator [Actinoplanes teichomyceticus]|nr:tetratricopeptide repeat protein [Actinoplanes teichomyceticus]GIF12475.1 hypothetical protein Ate01nite_25070 [Actinoplanes teichomyceticus]